MDVWEFFSFNRFISFNLYSEYFAVLFYILLFNFFTWILLELPEKCKALFI